MQLAESTLEAEEQSRTAAALKRKAQKLGQDMADLKLHLEEQVNRNAELEKKQRKYDFGFCIFTLLWHVNARPYRSLLY